MNHEKEDHIIRGSPHEQARRVLARHLCDWMTGHSAPVDRFLVSADRILEDMHEQGIRFHLVGANINPIDGFIEWCAK